MKNVVEFMELISSLKELQRTGWKQHEVTGIIDTTASHTFGVVLLSWLFSKVERIDVEKVLKMALVHDLVESIIGDLTPRDAKRVDRDRVEAEGLQIMESKVPDQLKNEIRSLVSEFQEGGTEESEIVRACDRLDTVFQAYYYRRHDRLGESGFREFLEYAKEACRKGPAKEILTQIGNMAEAKR